MNDAGDLSLELCLHRNDEAFAAHGDQLILCTPAVGERPQRAAQALFNGSMLPLHCLANPAQLGGGIVVQATIRLNLSAQQPQ